MGMFDHLFRPFAIGGVELRNRIVMLPMTTGYAELDQTMGDRRGEATALSNLAGITHQLGDLASTRHYYERSLALCQTTGDRQSESGVLNNLRLSR